MEVLTLVDVELVLTEVLVDVDVLLVLVELEVEVVVPCWAGAEKLIWTSP